MKLRSFMGQYNRELLESSDPTDEAISRDTHSQIIQRKSKGKPGCMNL